MPENNTINIKPISEKNALITMIVEAQNEITQCKITDRVYQRMNLNPAFKTVPLPNGQKVPLEMIMGANQKKIAQLEDTVKQYFDFLKDASDEIPLAKELGLEYTETTNK